MLVTPECREIQLWRDLWPQQIKQVSQGSAAERGRKDTCIRAAAADHEADLAEMMMLIT